MSLIEQQIQTVRDMSIEDLKMGKDPELVVLAAILGTVKVCLNHFQSEPQPNPTKKGGE